MQDGVCMNEAVLTFLKNLYVSSWGSMLILGGTDSSYYTGDIKWIPLYKATNFWNIQIQR